MSTGKNLNKKSYFSTCWEILKSEKKFWAFPIISFISFIILVLIPFIPSMIEAFSSSQNILDPSTHSDFSINYGFLFIYYILVYTASFYINAAFIIAVNDKIEGKKINVLTCLNKASTKLHHLFGWAIIASILAVIIRALEERKIIGFILAIFLSFSFSILCFFVLPIIALEDIGPIEAMRKSKNLFTKSWSDQVKARISFGFYAFMLALPGPAIIALGIMSQSILLTIIGILISSCISVVLYMMRTIYLTILYRHANGQSSSKYFSEEDLNNHQFKKSKFKTSAVAKA